MSLIYHTIVGLAILVALPAVILRIVFNAGFKSDLLARLRGYKSIESLEVVCGFMPPPWEKCEW